jgi:hypothetical protein
MEIIYLYNYRDFLVSQGDKDITYTEWGVCTENPVEDLCKLKYCYSRKIDFYHPRTDPMVSFMGPENASAQQTQYLYVDKPWAGKGGDTDLSGMKYHKGLILTVTQFTHIPMADVFKVLQYWSFEPKKRTGSISDNKKHEKHATIVQMCVGVHYNKYTMLKSKILSGTKDDLVVMVKTWAVYVVEVIKVESPEIASENKGELVASSSSNSNGAPLDAGEGPAATAPSEITSDLFADTNSKIEKLEKILKEAVDQRKGETSKIIYAISVLSCVVLFQFLIIFRLWSRS